VSESDENDLIRYTEIVDVSPADAFTAFVEHFAKWWPAAYTFAGESLQWIGMEPREGGRCLELDREGNELVWGEVTTFDAPVRVTFSWWIQPDRTIDDAPGRSSEIEVRFIDERALTRIEFEHRNLARHGEGWEAMNDALRSRHGWPMILQLYSDYTNSLGRT
jgi:hypothetical protein